MLRPKVVVVVVSVFNTLNTIDYRLTGGGHCCFFPPSSLKDVVVGGGNVRSAAAAGRGFAAQLFPFMYFQFGN